MNLQELLALLADGQFHSGEQMGAAAGLTRAAIWKQIRKLEKWGLQVEAGTGRGYRLSRPIELLNSQVLMDAMRGCTQFDVEHVEVLLETDSTNRYLMENPPSRPGALRICFAEWQSAGRGRRARRWVSPLGSGICMSAAWAYEGTPRQFSAMSLAAGAAIADAVSAHCESELHLKWPNDIVWNGRKLGGVLVESRIEAHGLCHVVIGLGLNVSLSDAELSNLSDWEAGAVDLRTILNGASCSRNAIAGDIASALASLLANFAANGADEWLQSWRTRDYLRGKSVRVGTEQSSFLGRADGIADDGALLVISDEGRAHRVVAGDASVRAQ